MLLTVVGCSGSVSGPDLRPPAISSRPRTRARLLAGPRPRSGGVRRAVQLPRPQRDRRRRAQPSASRPLPRPVRPLRRRRLLPDRAVAPPSGVRPGRTPPRGSPGRTRAAATGAATSSRSPASARAVRLRRLAADPAGRTVRGRTRRVDHPVEAYAIRVTENARAAAPRLLRRHRAQPGPGRLAAGADLLLVESAFLDGPDNPPGLHLTGRQAARPARPRGVGTVRAHPHPALARPASGARRGDAALRRPGCAGRVGRSGRSAAVCGRIG